MKNPHNSVFLYDIEYIVCPVHLMDIIALIPSYYKWYYMVLGFMESEGFPVPEREAGHWVWKYYNLAPELSRNSSVNKNTFSSSN